MGCWGVGGTSLLHPYLFGELGEKLAAGVASLKRLAYFHCPVRLAASNGHLARPVQNPLSSEHLERQHEQTDSGAASPDPVLFLARTLSVLQPFELWVQMFPQRDGSYDALSLLRADRWLGMEAGCGERGTEEGAHWRRPSRKAVLTVG